MGTFSIWHWLIVLLVLGVLILAIKMTVGKSNQANSRQGLNMASEDYRSGQTFGTIVIWFFVASIVADLLSVGSSVMQIDLLQRMESGGNWSDAEAEDNDTREAVIGWIVSAISLGCIISFLMWFHRVRANLPALGITDARWSPRWAVGWWFIPFMWWFRPYQIAKEVWKASSPTVTANNWREEPTPNILRIWWGLLILGSILYNVSGRMALTTYLSNQPTFSQIINSSIIDVIAATIWVISTFLAILVVKGINQRQAERVSSLSYKPKTSYVDAKVRVPEFELKPNPTSQHAVSAVQNASDTSIPNAHTQVKPDHSVKPNNIEPLTSPTILEEKECPRCQGCSTLII